MSAWVTLHCTVSSYCFCKIRPKFSMAVIHWLRQGKQQATWLRYSCNVIITLFTYQYSSPTGEAMDMYMISYSKLVSGTGLRLITWITHIHEIPASTCLKRARLLLDDTWSSCQDVYIFDHMCLCTLTRGFKACTPLSTFNIVVKEWTIVHHLLFARLSSWIRWLHKELEDL
jgi:hypothetical protein